MRGKKINQQKQTRSDTDDNMVKYSKTAIINIPQMFQKKRKETMSLLRRNGRYKKDTNRISND